MRVSIWDILEQSIRPDNEVGQLRATRLSLQDNPSLKDIQEWIIPRWAIYYKLQTLVPEIIQSDYGARRVLIALLLVPDEPDPWSVAKEIIRLSETDPHWFSGSVLDRNAHSFGGGATKSAADGAHQVINVEILDQDGHSMGQTPLLQVGQPYRLVFDVDLDAREASVLTRILDSKAFEPGEAVVELTVQLGSDDFSITGGPQPLIVMRDGHSSNRAYFSIRPVRSGRGILTAHLFKSGNFVQKLTIAVDVLAGSLDLVTPMQRQPLAVVSAGRPLASIGSLQPRNISITVDAKDDHFVLTVANGPRARLPFNVHELAGWIDDAQAALSEVVGWQRTGSNIEPYRAATEVSLADRDATLPILAEAGFRLYQHLFYDRPGAGADAAQVGDYLRNAVRSQRRLRLQFVSERYFWPWELLYVAERFDPAEVHPEWLLGLSHIIEYMPERQTDVFLPPEINCDPLLNVGLNVNLDIDSAMGQAFVGEQLRYWAAREAGGEVEIVCRTEAAEVKAALADRGLRDDLIYFYCHASAKQPPERSYLQFSNRGALTLADLKLVAPVRHDQRLVRAPLVVLNACESADLSPVFYDGFLPYLIMRGVRAVIGTACNVPAVFAAAWARRFFDLLFAGTPLAELMLQLRQEFFNEHNNVLGLLYGLYGEGDTRLITDPAGQDGMSATE